MIQLRQFVLCLSVVLGLPAIPDSASAQAQTLTQRVSGTLLPTSESTGWSFSGFDRNLGTLTSVNLDFTLNYRFRVRATATEVFASGGTGFVGFRAFLQTVRGLEFGDVDDPRVLSRLTTTRVAGIAFTAPTAIEQVRDLDDPFTVSQQIFGGPTFDEFNGAGLMPFRLNASFVDLSAWVGAAGPATVESLGLSYDVQLSYSYAPTAIGPGPTPVPEPESSVLLVIAVGMLGAIKWRRRLARGPVLRMQAGAI
jgi:hypothetical protein